MLDEIYSEQFDKIAKPILNDRKKGLDKLQEEVIRKEAKQDPIKKILKLLNEASDLAKENEEYFKDNGLKFNHSLYQDWKLEFGWSSENHPEIEAYCLETREVEQDLINKKKEIRSRIYGMNTTFEQVDAEIKEYIAGIK